MSFLLLHKGGAGTLLTDDPVVPAAEIPALQQSLKLLSHAEGRLETVAQQAAALADAAKQEGFEAGRRLGEAAAAAQISARLFDLEVKAAQIRAEQRVEAAKLAIEIVRRIAAEVGTETLVAGLAEKAASELAPDTHSVVRVSPASRESVSERLARFDRLTVTADPLLSDDDCVVETSSGVIRAGLETQLAAIERAWTGSVVDA